MKEIKQIIEAYDIFAGKTNMALATVVYVEGSSYRRIGARMLVLEDGKWFGGVSGGCLEGDALKKAKKAMLGNVPSLVDYDTREEDNYQIGVGLGCNGLIKIMFVPLTQRDEFNSMEILKSCVLRREASQLIHFIGPKTSVHFGQTIDISESIVKRPKDKISSPMLTALKQLKYARKSRVLDFEFENKSFKLLVEQIRPTMRLNIIGHHKDVVAMVNLAYSLGWDVFVFGNKNKLPKDVYSKTVAVYDYDDLSQAAIDAYTATVFMTHDLDTDVRLISSLDMEQINYLGIMGPKSRFDKVSEQVYESNPNIDLRNYTQVYAPVGLDIGSTSPEEIHLSIIAEIIAVFSAREGGYLKLRQGPIN
jgi:xanthine/CO dehydrogenase XdhC/CoxF family maturation factor